MYRTLPFLAAGLCLLTPATGQSAPITGIRHTLSVDSGWIDNTATAPRVVFRHVVRIPGSSWLRVFFDQTHLPTGSHLRLTSLLDRDVQTLPAGPLVDYGHASCYLNGAAVAVELVAGPGTRGNRVWIVAALAGVAAAETICGPNDDRKQSFDKRQCRFDGRCTGWLFGKDAIGSAGHCGNTSSVMIMEFNVPDSTASGSLVRSKVVDQYPTAQGTARLLASGVGADWLVARMGRNSQTGKLPGEVQGAWYRLGTVPTTTGGQQIRITGYGTSGIRTLNQVQKTHVGPLYGVQATYLQYQTDTTGGNSGSPIIHENSGAVVGVHTHGGCGYNGGANQGTRIDRPDFQAAIKGLIGAAGKVAYYGSGCGSASAVPVLQVIGSPDIHRLIRIQTSNLPSSAAGVQFLGLRRAAADLTAIGLPGCTQWVSIDVLVSLPSDALGHALLLANIPNDTGLVGQELYLQYAAADAPRRTTVVSNAAQVIIGYQ